MISSSTPCPAACDHARREAVKRFIAAGQRRMINSFLISAVAFAGFKLRGLVRVQFIIM
ncbi:MAG: hypothetical protein ACREJM_11325 [Candidatus Saccharimonadales bacterium]